MRQGVGLPNLRGQRCDDPRKLTFSSRALHPSASYGLSPLSRLTPDADYGIGSRLASVAAGILPRFDVERPHR